MIMRFILIWFSERLYKVGYAFGHYALFHSWTIPSMRAAVMSYSAHALVFS